MRSSLWSLALCLGSSLALAAPTREKTSFLPIVLGMSSVANESPTPPAPQETWLITAALQARGIDPAAMPPGVRAGLLSAVPSYPPAFGPITSGFGSRASPFGGRRAFHNGLDIGARQGSGVYAVSPGVVVHAGWKPELGRTVVLDHGNGMTTIYAHMSRTAVVKGEQVPRGSLLGKVGSTGRSTGSHLHYEVRIGGAAVDPARFFVLGPTGEGSSGLFALGGTVSSTARLVAGIAAVAGSSGRIVWR